VVDAERLGRIITRIRDVVRQIRTRSQAHDLTRDDVALDAVKYGFVTAIEGCVRAAAHVTASEGFGLAESNADTVRLLGAHGVLPDQVAEQVARAVGFRNVLVHQYADVDDDVVRANVALLDDLDAFTAALAGWVTRDD
jgi:uncharacterized protein YutE (UPF0331/DUF86 family)